MSSCLAQIRYDRAISRSSRPVLGHRVMTCFDHVSYWFARPSSCRPPSKTPLLTTPREFCFPIARPRSRESDFRSSISCRIGSAGQIPSTPFGDPESTSPMHSSPIEVRSASFNIRRLAVTHFRRRWLSTVLSSLRPGGRSVAEGSPAQVFAGVIWCCLWPALSWNAWCLAARSPIRVAGSDGLPSRSVAVTGSGSAERRGSILWPGWRRRSSVSAAMARCRELPVACSQSCRSAMAWARACSRCWRRRHRAGTASVPSRYTGAPRLSRRRRCRGAATAGRRPWSGRPAGPQGRGRRRPDARRPAGLAAGGWVRDRSGRPGGRSRRFPGRRRSRLPWPARPGGPPYQRVPGRAQESP